MKSARALIMIVTFISMAMSAESDKRSLLGDLKWRNIGPANMGGRVSAIEGVAGDPNTYYVGGADGGIFKTINNGVTFDEIFNDQDAYSIGAITVAPSDANVIWVGTGEGDPRNSVGYGRGVYRSIDGGITWVKAGLEKTERIKRIVVDPRDPDVVSVCALGREWGPNPERGVFITHDGGKKWEKVLYIDEDTGCSDITMENSNPRIMYAGMWTFRRKPWRFDGGSKKTALYRTMNGGKNWNIIHNGLPDGPMTRIGVQVAQSEPNIVYLVTEIKDGGTLFRSDDRGENWKKVHDDARINFRPFYYSDIRVDPTNPDHLYSLSGGLYKSTDGGQKFERIAGGVHGDHQSFWIDPVNSRRLLSGSDGGYQVSYDAGANWDVVNNVTLSQFYQIFVDDETPYNVLGGLQDNGTWRGPSRTTNSAGILKDDWNAITGGDGYYAVPVPGKSNIIYSNLQGGVIFQKDMNTGNTRTIHPYPKITGSAGDAIKDHKYRFNWDSPILISPHDPKTVYFGGNVLFKTTDEGYSWEVISPDLTTNDKSKQLTSGGEIYQDNTAAEFHCSILTIAESHVQEGVIWVGTDDGNVHITTDGGKKWTDITKRISGMPKNSWVGKIDASHFDAGTAYIAIDHHRSDDFKPYVFKVTNFGKRSENLSRGLPQNDYVKVVREDSQNSKLLYAGMEHGIYASWDGGKKWSAIMNNLPPVSVRDIKIQTIENDLVIGTHGRGAWILDDITPLQEMANTKSSGLHIFQPRTTYRWQMSRMDASQGQREYRAENPPYGAIISFHLATGKIDTVKIKIADSEGNHVSEFKVDEPKPGFNRTAWNLRYDGAVSLATPITGGWRGGNVGPTVAPGKYTVTLSTKGQSASASLEVRKDPRIEVSNEDFRKQLEAGIELRDMLSKVNTVLNGTESVMTQMSELKKKVKDFSSSDFDLTEAEGKIKNVLQMVKEFRNDELKRPINGLGYRQRPRLREELRSLAWAVDGTSARPTNPQMLRMKELDEETEAVVRRYNSIVENEVAEINQILRNFPQVSVKQATYGRD
ncbi:MAG TPA: hypothetical protein QGG35_02960 [Candidatus Marinimicrobia bacterium]|nr:hypothetical protein [Candidatus Neomarinimicrobiota bacterium]MDP7436187.1 hypothetical protein [Candidatus Neomarinimicrobiota bacterium]HJL84340.1 hypothetical protein [Candidatus Neomarinimicrobiota bacterium]